MAYAKTSNEPGFKEDYPH